MGINGLAPEPHQANHLFDERMGAGDGPCAILMAGARGEGKQLHYPRSELAARYDASAPHETTEPREAYSDWKREFVRVPPVWPV